MKGCELGTIIALFLSNPGISGTKILIFIGFMEDKTMKKRILAYAFVVFAALSCSSTSRLQTQVYDDGVYSRPAVSKQSTVVVADSEVDNLLAESRSSAAYIINDGADTLIVPAGKTVIINPETNVTVLDNSDWWWGYTWSIPFYYYSWYRPWYYDSWYYGPRWRYYSW